MISHVSRRLRALLSLLCSTVILTGCAANPYASTSPASGPAVEVALAGGHLRGPTASAVIDLLKLDHFFHRCRSEAREVDLTDAGFSRMGQCFRDAQLPAHCASYWPSIAKLAELAVAEPSFNVLLPDIALLVAACSPRPLPTARPAQRDVDVSPLDVALSRARHPTTPPLLVPRATEHYEFICRMAVEPDSGAVTVGEIFLCNHAATGGPGRGRDFYISRIRHYLVEGNDR